MASSHVSKLMKKIRELFFKSRRGSFPKIQIKHAWLPVTKNWFDCHPLRLGSARVGFWMSLRNKIPGRVWSKNLRSLKESSKQFCSTCDRHGAYSLYELTVILVHG